MKTKIFLDSAITHHQEMNNTDINYRYINFYYFNTLKDKNKYIEDWYKKNVVIYLDFGSNFIVNHHKKLSNESFFFKLDSYIYKYLTFILEHRSIIYGASECDILNVLLSKDIKLPNNLEEEVLAYNPTKEEYRDIDYTLPFLYNVKTKLKETAVPIFTIWNPIFNFDVWDSICKRNKYVAFSYKAIKDKVRSFMSTVRAYGCRTHCFGFSNDATNKYGFDSCSTNSWIDGSRYGVTHVWEDSSMRWYNKSNKDIRKHLKEECKEASVNYKDFIDGDVKATNYFQLHNWKQMIDFYSTEVNFPVRVRRIDSIVGGVPKIIPTNYGDKIFKKKIEGLVEKKGGEIVYEEKGEDFLHEVTKEYESDNKEIATRDSKGELTFQNIVSYRMCKNCNLKANCPYADDTKTCYFDEHVSFDSPKDVFDGAVDLLAEQYRRVKRALLEETMQGEGLNKEASKEMKIYFDMTKILKDLGKKDEDIVIMKGAKAREYMQGGSAETPQKESLISNMIEGSKE